MIASVMSGGLADLDLLLQLHVGGGRQVQLLRQLRHLRLQGALRRPAALTPLQGNQSQYIQASIIYRTTVFVLACSNTVDEDAKENPTRPRRLLTLLVQAVDTAGALASPGQHLCSALLMCLCAYCGVICRCSVYSRLWRGLTREWREPEPWLPVSILTPFSKCDCAPTLTLSSSHAMGDEWPELSLPLHHQGDCCWH